MKQLPEDKSLILFDGYCHLCSGVVQTIVRHDRKFHFLFAPLNSPQGKEWRSYLKISDSIDSIILIEGEKAYVFADAAMRVASKLGGFYAIFKVGYFLPKKWRDAIYRWVARRRTGWFGRRDSCYLPNASAKDRFL
ncbi:thiol-disulfide oxidoreductase DCC family protein [Mangrovibacterium lignilyticum]|uniref:thiol-disulfide oxidoreductase DCC family protein n=1 Tax=Mangrovibacterium lignilyticum TaxID=2668052 RepID=UPI0013D70842|nr:DCC1-like thiol-disulfide oxidoreductase family protein [Mangrovibacterium lignilyticum]